MNSLQKLIDQETATRAYLRHMGRLAQTHADHSTPAHWTAFRRLEAAVNGLVAECDGRLATFNDLAQSVQ